MRRSVHEGLRVVASGAYQCGVVNMISQQNYRARNK